MLSWKLKKLGKSPCPWTGPLSIAGTLTVKVLTPFVGKVKLRAVIDEAERKTVSVLDGTCPPNTMLFTKSKNMPATSGFSDEPGENVINERHQSQTVVPVPMMLVPGPAKEKNALSPALLGKKGMLTCVMLNVGTLSA
jgi:hypothetical protein